MKVEINRTPPVISAEYEVGMERMLHAAMHYRDTPLDSGFGFAGQNMPTDLESEDVEVVTTIRPVPYCGDERPYIHITRPPIDPFMRDLPA